MLANVPRRWARGTARDQTPAPLEGARFVPMRGRAARIGARLADLLAAKVFVGTLCSRLQPYAARYGGHQFGNLAALGDAARSRSRTDRRDGRRYESSFMARATPYSRTADGPRSARSRCANHVQRCMHTSACLRLCLSPCGLGESYPRLFYKATRARRRDRVPRRPPFVRSATPISRVPELRAKARDT